MSAVIDTHDAVAYLDDFVEPTILDFQQHPASRRHAFIACVVTFHCIDYLTPVRGERRKLREQFRRTSEDFSIVDRVAHAFKHMNSDWRQLHYKEVFERPPARSGVAQCGLSRAGDTDGRVQLADHSDLLQVVTSAALFLREQCAVAVART
jgi:hypothetical protein